MIGDIVNRINALYCKRLDNIRSLSDMSYDLNLVHPYLDKSANLSYDEKKEIENKWGVIIPYLKRGYAFYKALKVIDKFDSNYLPASYYSPIVEDTLNPIRFKYNLSHKGLSELFYREIVKFPYSVLRSFNGIYFDRLYRPLTPNEASKILLSHLGEPLLYKPALGTCQGKGIIILNDNNITDLADDIKLEKTNKLFDDFIIQEFVPQSPATKEFNPTSLNCMRITTLNLNGEISICSRAIKFGPKDSLVDNIGTGKRGVAVGLTPNGTLMDFGFYGNGEKTSSHNGIVFGGMKIPNFEGVINKAKELHSVNTGCKLIGWDLAVDSNGDVVLIEGNTVCPSISFEQMATGPIFGNRTEEVIDYIANRIKR